jgi:hypothetical protein
MKTKDEELFYCDGDECDRFDNDVGRVKNALDGEGFRCDACKEEFDPKERDRFNSDVVRAIHGLIAALNRLEPAPLTGAVTWRFSTNRTCPAPTGGACAHITRVDICTEECDSLDGCPLPMKPDPRRLRS